MKIELARLDSDYLMEATNEIGNTVRADGAVEIGGHNLAFRPMQLMLAGLGSCSAIDVISLLRKQRQDLQDIKITIDADRQVGVVPSLFTEIRLHFRLYGTLDDRKVERAVNLSMEKICSVAKLLEKTATLKWSWEVIGV